MLRAKSSCRRSPTVQINDPEIGTKISSCRRKDEDIIYTLIYFTARRVNFA